MTLTDHFSPTFGTLSTILMTPLRALANWNVRVMENHPRLKKVEALRALSDEQLAQRGMKRTDIVAHVFSDRMHL
ncbi:MAG: hypothetical protein ACI9IV_000553 [Paracoccaceae bacterium]|jgi:uncharacterized protein YjiS (DUF1127 family)|tara:strand:+ start:427 stop:651 length:225 start_codon:yes stop_codon:yes gene_type:complete